MAVSGVHCPVDSNTILLVELLIFLRLIDVTLDWTVGLLSRYLFNSTKVEFSSTVTFSNVIKVPENFLGSLSFKKLA